MMFPLTPEQTPLPRKRRDLERIATTPESSSRSTGAGAETPQPRIVGGTRLIFPNAATSHVLGSGRVSSYTMRTHHLYKEPSTVVESPYPSSHPASVEHVGTRPRTTTPSSTASSHSINLPGPSPRRIIEEQSIPQKYIDVQKLASVATPGKQLYRQLESTPQEIRPVPKEYDDDGIPKGLLEEVEAEDNAYFAHPHHEVDVKRIPGMWCVFRGKKVFRPFMDGDRSWLDYKPKVLFPKADASKSLADSSEPIDWSSSTKASPTCSNMFPRVASSKRKSVSRPESLSVFPEIRKRQGSAHSEEVAGRSGSDLFSSYRSHHYNPDGSPKSLRLSRSLNPDISTEAAPALVDQFISTGVISGDRPLSHKRRRDDMDSEDETTDREEGSKRVRDVLSTPHRKSISRPSSAHRLFSSVHKKSPMKNMRGDAVADMATGSASSSPIRPSSTSRTISTPPAATKSIHVPHVQRAINTPDMRSNGIYFYR